MSMNIDKNVNISSVRYHVCCKDGHPRQKVVTFCKNQLPTSSKENRYGLINSMKRKCENWHFTDERFQNCS